MSLPSDNTQKTPFAQSLEKFVTGKSNDATWMQGKGLPCSVETVVSPGVVTVSFRVAAAPFTLPFVTIPVVKPPYVQYPIQVGDLGLAIPASTFLGHITGLGTGVPSLQDTAGNLATLSFMWLGHKDEAFIDPNALTLNGNILCTQNDLAFFAGTRVNKRTISGALSAVTDTNAKAVLTSIIAALAGSGYNLVNDGTS